MRHRRWIAGMAIAAMFATNASAQDCGDRVNWVCAILGLKSSAAPKDAAEGFQQDRAVAPQPGAAAAEPEGAQKDPSALAHARRVARHGHRQRLSSARMRSRDERVAEAERPKPFRSLDAGEKELLFQEFLQWHKKQLLDADMSR